MVIGLVLGFWVELRFGSELDLGLSLELKFELEKSLYSLSCQSKSGSRFMIFSKNTG